MDYKKLGLKCGIEIHQQLDSHKLFCECPSVIRTDQPDVIVRRRLRASAGESGETDVAAKFESEKDKTFIYQAYTDTTCGVELDEEPPHDLDPKSLSIALQSSIMLDSKPVENIQVMRKTVVDGSNTSGFQRTALVALGGKIATSLGDVRIATVAVEEESAKIINRSAGADVYNLSRLGIPLIEIATEPDIQSPEHARETAEKIGLVLRSTQSVKRGLGTIRQDLNVSIKDGARIEIKGAQDLKLMSTQVENEVKRQYGLLKIRDELKKRKTSEIKAKAIDLSRIFSKSDSIIMKNAIKGSGVILGQLMPKFEGLLGVELSPKRRLGTELSDYAKKFSGVGGLFHSDELPAYGITSVEVEDVRVELGAGPGDAFILIADDKKKAELAIKEAIARTNICFDGVPKEVRKANPDGSTTFLRPMPGAARLYPETDVKSIHIDLSKIKKAELIEEKTVRFQKIGLSKDLADKISRHPKVALFENSSGKNSAFIADFILSYEKELKREKLNPDLIEEEQLEQIFKALNKGAIGKGAVAGITKDIAAGKELILENYENIPDKELEKKLKEIVKKNKGKPFGALMGLSIQKYGARADGKKIANILKKLMK